MEMKAAKRPTNKQQIKMETIDNRTECERRRDQRMRDIIALYQKKIPLLADPTKPQRVFPVIARETGYTATYVRKVLTDTGHYIPRTRRNGQAPTNQTPQRP